SPSYSPRWQQPMAVDTRGLVENEPVTIEVIDAIDESLIAHYQTTLGKVVDRAASTLAENDAAATLDVLAEPLPRREPSTFLFGVPGNATIASLVRERPAGWQAIPIWNGDHVSITSTGTVCLSDHTRCIGPHGSARDYGEPVDAPRGAL